MPKILIVDDEAAIRKTLKEILEFEKYEVDMAVDGLEAIVMLKRNDYAAIIMDIKMPKLDGMEALERIKLLKADTPVIMISGHATIDSAVEAVKKGAFDFVSKPPDLNRLLITIRNAIDRRNLITDNKKLKTKVRSKNTPEIIGNSAEIMHIKKTIEKVGPSDARVLITGENGTGKELVARWLHHHSNRSKGPLVEVNCAAIPRELIESELFGHEKGSFTGAMKQHMGKFEQANGGTLFLDEIGDMDLDAQAKVLRALQESMIARVGGNKKIKVDVRVVAATNKNLEEEINQGRFRRDLYHRLAVILLNVPSLNERRDDIPLLVKHFNQQLCEEYGITPKSFTNEALIALQNCHWSGNIRELRNVVERLIILGGNSIGEEDVRRHVIPNSHSTTNERYHEMFKRFKNVDEIHKFIDNEYQQYKKN